MARFRSKSFEVEATQWRVFGDHPAVEATGEPAAPHVAKVRGKQGWSGVNVGDWIIAEPDSSGFYPCAPDVFAAKYEPVN